MTTAGDGIFTLEPLMEAVREGVELAGWRLSGMQKTTSHQFEGRWEGESTRSAYLFFHRPDAAYEAGIDVYLDETSRGLSGNLALVVDLLRAADLGPAEEALASLGALASSALSQEHRTPLTLRLRLGDAADEPSAAETEVRFKLRIPKAAIGGGAGTVRRLAASTVEAFESLLRSPELARFAEED